MMYINKLVNLQKYAWTTRLEAMEVILYSFAGFFLPFILGHPQWLVGTIVNAMLISGALTVRGYKLLPIILLPSFGVLAAGAIFGTFTVFLLYLVPFIWLGNAVLVMGMKYLNIEKKSNYAVSLIVSAAAKSLLLFGAAYLLVSFGIIPAMFLTAMGVLQIATALSGGVLAYGFELVKRRI